MGKLRRGVVVNLSAMAKELSDEEKEKEGAKDLVCEGVPESAAPRRTSKAKSAAKSAAKAKAVAVVAKAKGKKGTEVRGSTKKQTAAGHEGKGKGKAKSKATTKENEQSKAVKGKALAKLKAKVEPNPKTKAKKAQPTTEMDKKNSLGKGKLVKKKDEEKDQGETVTKGRVVKGEPRKPVKAAEDDVEGEAISGEDMEEEEEGDEEGEEEEAQEVDEEVEVGPLDEVQGVHTVKESREQFVARKQSYVEKHGEAGWASSEVRMRLIAQMPESEKKRRRLSCQTLIKSGDIF